MHLRSLPGLALIMLLAGCATRPVNPPLAQADSRAGYRFETRQPGSEGKNDGTLVILAFSGGGTRSLVLLWRAGVSQEYPGH